MEKRKKVNAKYYKETQKLCDNDALGYHQAFNSSVPETMVEMPEMISEPYF